MVECDISHTFSKIWRMLIPTSLLSFLHFKDLAQLYLEVNLVFEARETNLAYLFGKAVCHHRKLLKQTPNRHGVGQRNIQQAIRELGAMDGG